MPVHSARDDSESSQQLRYPASAPLRCSDSAGLQRLLPVSVRRNQLRQFPRCPSRGRHSSDDAHRSKWHGAEGIRPNRHPTIVAMPSEQRSRTMRAVKDRDTKPEMVVRRLLHSMGYRYCLHRKDLPGKPDIVFGPRRKVIFVHGCFWHGHSCKRGSRLPKTNAEYWQEKIARNVERHSDQLDGLTAAGWTGLTLWECELVDHEVVRQRLNRFLDDS